MPLIRSANCNLFVEIFIRIMLISIFCYMETMTPVERVIHKEDLETIYKYPRKDSYVPGSVLWSIVLSVPFTLSLIAWAFYNDCNDALEFLLAWSLALGINGVVTDTIKLISGRPRPDYFYRCFPDGAPPADLVCTGDANDVLEGRKSFPSGHSSLSFCSLSLASSWLAGRLGTLSRARTSGPRTLAALAPLLLATCVALSRHADYHHHWQDILAGSILGFSVGVFCYRQFYNALSGPLAGLPYVVTSLYKTDSTGKERDETSPLLNGRKEDKWI